MQELQLPTYAFKVRMGPKGEQIFDPVRRKYVALEPEEWVRQHFINYLVQYRHCPLSLITVESSLELNRQPLRSDILVHDRQGQPLCLVECKAPTVKLGQQAVEQMLRYERALQAKYLIISNGMLHFCWKVLKAEKRLEACDEIPLYDQMEQAAWMHDG